MTWETPKGLFDEYNEIYEFDLDAAACHHNAKCDRFISPIQDALSMSEWPGKRIWLNPPYGRGLGQWYAKAQDQAHRYGKLVVMLVPARTDTRYWHDYVWDRVHHRPRPGVQVHFIKGRVRFVGADNGAPFPSAVVIFQERALP